MNFNAIDKMSSENVTNLLKEIPNSEATRQYLILTRNILDAFLLKELVLRSVYTSSGIQHYLCAFGNPG